MEALRPNIEEIAPELVEAYIENEKKVVPELYEKFTREEYFKKYLAYYDTVLDNYCKYYEISDNEKINFFPNIVALAQKMAFSYSKFCFSTYEDDYKDTSPQNINNEYFRNFEIALSLLGQRYGIHFSQDSEKGPSYL